MNKPSILVLMLLTAIGLIFTKNTYEATSIRASNAISATVSNQIETNKLLARRFFEEIVG